MPLFLPPPALVTAPWTLQATGLNPHAPVTIDAQTTDRHGERWRSQAVFQPEASGVVDVARHAPLSGSYAGTDPRGLLWSLRPRTDLIPAIFETPPDGYEVAVQLWQGGRLLEEGRTFRQTRRPGLESVDVRQSGLHGTLFCPPAEVPLRGAALQLGGSEGGLSPAVGALLASEGFLVLSVAYFGVPGLPPSLINLPLEYFHRAISFLRSCPEAAGRRIGITGASKGAEAALLLGATYPDEVGAVAAFAPSGLVFEGIDRVGSHPPGQPKSSWSLGGQPLPYLPYRVDWGAVFAGPPPIRLTPAHQDALHGADPGTVAAATIPTERIRGPVLLVSGGDDQVWNAHELSMVAQQRRDVAGRLTEHLTDPRAGHALSVPGFPTFIRTPWTALGGTDEANARLQFRAWERTLDVLGSVWLEEG
ncbi:MULTISPECIES: acyl-CoA thioesterase/bile acid-CoA:amino acid N-acyltransferase family protein [Deinococcus]|uniref:Acyl-CoA thioesterase/bile acid-CoA:amino acid N-acyltransferase family protein n=1 Tax=Deinococcus rufus TaxID=2136097 RepID=A0ABV7ZEH9_9DEIO|nr:acyl-CoA thioesterase/bile acid-CoA:amino acid N-acyltransferase family protein [Deinococcus sp. AB2017081]WQE96956.1 acyl-CoA thioesterase/bile acid-CoA:amino acid N-acyltransferase family protein [Deinococcus sp. AB2017081]